MNGYYERSVQKSKAGYFNRFGVFNSYSISKRMRVSGELLLGIGSMSTSTKSNRGVSVTDISTKTTYITTHSIELLDVSLPVKVHYSFKKDGKLSVMLGMGVACLVNADVRLVQEIRGGTEPATLPFSNTPGVTRIGAHDLRTRYSIEAGWQYRLSQSTAVGIRISLEPGFLNPPLSLREPVVYPFIPRDFVFNFPYFEKSLRLASLSLVIRHNLLQ